MKKGYEQITHLYSNFYLEHQKEKTKANYTKHKYYLQQGAFKPD